MVSAQPHVQTIGVTKIFRDFWNREKVAAVRELDLEIFPKEVFGLLGPNGSGKSTAIKMILGLLYPTKGYIRVFGQSPRNVAIKARIGFLPEESNLYPFLNARETLDYYGRLFGQPRPDRRRRIEMLLDMVGLSAVAYRRVGEYSKGMQRRIGLAQALINDPDLLILDEPTSGMDPLGTRQFKDLICQLGRRGKTVILSSHLLADVEDVCDRVGVLYGGRMRAIGSLSEMLSKRELTQITTERLSDTAVAAIRRVAAGESKDVLEVRSPRDRLETFFLRIVQEAQDERISTGGAVATGEVAEFLRAEPAAEAQAVIDELLGASEPAPTAEPDRPAPPAPPPADRVVDDLIEQLTAAAEPAKPGEEGEEEGPAPERPPAPAADEAAEGVIQSLLVEEESAPEKVDDA